MSRKDSYVSMPNRNDDQTYIGGELELFAQAKNWKTYWISQLRPYLGETVLEVGAGIGTNTQLLLNSGTKDNGGLKQWLCLEPDLQMVGQLRKDLAELMNKVSLLVRSGTVESLTKEDMFDTILYIDVLEHIADDRAELARASAHLKTGGKLIVLSPAHGWLFSEFDRSIGHYRRYTVATLVALQPTGLSLTKSFYLDSVGLLASVANRCLLKQSLPSPRQIKVWDSLMVPCSQLLDPLMGRLLGKTVVAIWTKVM